MEPLKLARTTTERGASCGQALASSLTRAGMRLSTAEAIAPWLGDERRQPMRGCGGGDCRVAEPPTASSSDGHPSSGAAALVSGSS